MSGGKAILLTGGAGQVGTEFRRLAPEGVEIVAPGRDRLDMADPDSIAAFVAARPWAAVINSAAYTAVDKAESDPVTAWKVNALGPAALAWATSRAGVPLIHLSTDYVFDGAKPSPYLEDDPIGPLGVYGASKEAGEQAVRVGNPRHVILRTAWVVSPHGANFIKTMLRMAQSRDRLTVVDDQHGCPTSATDIAAALHTIAARMVEDPAAPTGVYHFVNSGEATWCELAREVFALAKARGRAVPTVEAIPTSAYPTPARRPGNSRLDTAKLRADFGVTPRPWRTAIAEVVETLLAGQTD
ncbi:MAG TPA: dTDP-4-dehydrorhamnose reductase [Phenylobacterium sp.]|nr:dTDP-4-dehydrorhamnose reductase [Phenylobacterium sp.]